MPQPESREQISFAEGGNGFGHETSTNLDAAAALIEGIGRILDTYRTTLENKRDDENDFYTELTNNYPVDGDYDFESTSDITTELGRLNGIVRSLRTAEQTHQTEIVERDAFFISDGSSSRAGSAFASRSD